MPTARPAPARAEAPAAPASPAAPQFIVPAAPAPAVTVAPQIVMPPAPPAQIVVQMLPADSWRTWLPMLFAALSACIAALTAFSLWRSHVFGFRKDAAAVAREIRAREAAGALAAFENNVARPVGMALDQVERLTMEVGKLRPAADVDRDAALERYGSGLVADHNHVGRLCREADDTLGHLRRPPAFRAALVAAHLDDLFLAAAGEALSPTSASRMSGVSAYEAALEAVTRFKVEIRRLLEAERATEGSRWAGRLSDDPLNAPFRKWLPDGAMGPAA